MCGIFGAVGESVTDAVLEEMARRLRHRGPDGLAIERRVGCALGLVRLAIVGAHEPAQVFRVGRASAVMNGELYNHRELRRGLEVPGASDAALVPELFEREGPAFVDRLQGPFAIALYDGQALHLIRDRLGKKPLYFRAHGAGLFFASEQKALVATPGFAGRVDREVVEAFTRRGYLRDDELVFAELQAVAPGEWVSVDRRGRLVRRRWWTLEARLRRRSAGRPLALLEQTLARAVESRVPEEVPWALLLSGGLDSTVIGARVKGQLAHAFCMERPGAGDAARARRAAQALGVPLEVVRLPAPDVETFRRALFHLEQPDAYASWAMAPAVLQLGAALRARGVKVALMGEGADELFLGYGWDLLQAEVERGGGRLPPDAVRLLGAHAKYFGLHHAAARLWAPRPRARDVWLATGRGATLSPDIDSGWPPSLPGARRRQLVGLGHDMLTLPILHADRLLMASGIEPRMPFLDHRVVELALRIAPAALEQPGVDKPLLRSLARRWVPRWTAPPKAGFSAESSPPPEVVEALRRELSTGTAVVVGRDRFRARRQDVGLLWRHVVLELTARQVLASSS